MSDDTNTAQSELERLCSAQGMRMTGQRRVIAQVLSEASDHPDAEEVHRRVSSLEPGISLSTVYRTIKLFEDAGILERHDFGEGRARYEQAGEDHHDHLIDLDSGEVIEFHDAEIERLQERIAEGLGYELVGHRLELYARRRGVGHKPVISSKPGEQGKSVGRGVGAPGRQEGREALDCQHGERQEAGRAGGRGREGREP